MQDENWMILHHSTKPPVPKCEGLQWGPCCMSSCVNQQCVIVLSHACRGETAAKCAAASIDCRQARHGASHRQCPHRPLYSYTTLNMTKNQLTKTALSCSYKASCNVKHSPLCLSSISVKPTGVKTKSSLNLIKDVKKQFWKIHHRLPS